MSEPKKPIQLNIPAALTALAGITDLLTRLNDQRNETPVEYIEPSTPTARFGSSCATVHRDLLVLIEATNFLTVESKLNQKLLNLLNAIGKDARRFADNLAANTIDITTEIATMGQPPPPPPGIEPGNEWKQP